MKILVFEDEIPAQNKLLSLINDHIPNCEIQGTARTVRDAVVLLSSNDKPDLIFSDIELLDGSAFRIYEQCQVHCPIIFCTAFDQYLFQAFQGNGIAYLLKPYSKQEFAAAYAKFQRLFSNTGQQLSPDVLRELKSVIAEKQKDYKSRFTVKKRNGIMLLASSDIVSFEAQGDFSFAYDKSGERHTINMSLGNIESKLDPKQFFRINRSVIVQLSYIEHMEPHFKNRLSVRVTGQQDLLQTSSGKTASFRIWLES